MRIVKIIFYLFVFFFGISFAALNSNAVKINFYVTTWIMPVSVLAAIMIAIGILVGLLISLSKFWRLKKELRQIKEQLRLTEKEIKNLRAIPLKDQH